VLYKPDSRNSQIVFANDTQIFYYTEKIKNIVSVQADFAKRPDVFTNDGTEIPFK
jgi:hypothetical protein